MYTKTNGYEYKIEVQNIAWWGFTEHLIKLLIREVTTDPALAGELVNTI